VLIRVNVDNPADKITEFGAGAKLYWARDNTSATGAFSDATGNVALVATQTQYEIIDSTGAVGHYYRTRIGNTGGTSFDEWAPVFQAGAATAYATLDALREYLNPPDNSQDNLLSDLLADASAYLDTKIGRDFYRHPQITGTEIRTFNGSASSFLPVAAGMVSLTLVELATQTGGAYTSLAATDWALYPFELSPEASYSALVLSNVGNYPYWYSGIATVRLTGVFGSASVPAMIRKATLDLAREWYRQGPGGGGPVGVNQFGTPIFGGGLPLSVKQAIDQYGPALVA
jgi:hypothetical protein